MKICEFIEKLKMIKNQDSTINFLFEFCMNDDPPNIIEVKSNDKNYVVFDFDHREERTIDDDWKIEDHVYGA